MKDKGCVISTEKDLAQVEVECLEGCHSCAVKNICLGQKQSKGLLSVKNPIQASPGDEVMIEIPESAYTGSLILVFGGLLLASLLGVALGYGLSRLTGWPLSESSLAGLLLCVITMGCYFYISFREKNERHLYPRIIDIIRKGDCHG